MPTWQRKFIYHEIKEFYEKENGQNTSENVAINPDGTIKNPDIFNNQNKKSPPISKPGVIPKNRPTTYK